MPKQIFKDGKLLIQADENNAQDKLKILKKQYKNKELKSITDVEKVTLFNAYVDAGVIKL